MGDVGGEVAYVESLDPTVSRLRPFATTIFAEMTELALRHDAVNLGQGFPDDDGPAEMLRRAQQAIADGFNQYPPGRGMLVLRAAISADRHARYGQIYDPDSEVLVTVGATEAISAAILGLVEAGDEVLLIEPYYDSYAASVALAGATRRTIPLVRDGDGFALDLDALRAAPTAQSRILIVNSPHNPTGMVLTEAALQAIADVACEHNLIVLADEVYEHLTFGARKHLSIASLPGMRERTIVISSAAKTFNVTGWKTGWACGPAPLVDAVRAAKQWMSFVGAAPFQPAVAYALEHEQDWIAASRTSFDGRRRRLDEALRSLGLDVLRCDGSYFICTDVAPLGAGDAMEFCRELPGRIGVAAVPVSVFADHPERFRNVVRFTFCKSEDTMREGIERLAHLR